MLDTIPFKMTVNTLMHLIPGNLYAQSAIDSGGIVGTLILMALVLVLTIMLAIYKFWQLLSFGFRKKNEHDQKSLDLLLENLNEEQLAYVLKKQQAGDYKLQIPDEKAEGPFQDSRGIIIRSQSDVPHAPMFEKKKLTIPKVNIDNDLKKVVIGFLGSAVGWLIFGSLVGQYVGMKFIWPEIDHISWLSFGRLRPVHTNAVFWGWASMAMLGLGYFVVSRTCNTKIFSPRMAWVSLILINTSVLLGSLSLMNGISNGGGEYREYIWPIALLFALGLLLSLYNYVKTIANRNTTEIYVSNWYIMGACTWTLILVTIGYLPFYQNGLGETIIQGYHMHQAVGMWFMTFTLGLVYYFLPQALNKPIYSYALGVLAFWTQMLFYTLIGTHHFIFSPLPWSLQTIAIVFSMGMLIPVIAGTTNFLMTFRGSWTALKSSYVLPFLLVGVVFYFIGSGQGTMQAFRYSNLVWHFNDFNVAHSHMTMYGIITFLMWGGMYYLLPRLTNNRLSEFWVGVHFWMALVGLLIYMWSLMIGGTLKGISWLNEEPFLESVVLMAPYWLWRAIGGTMMFISHLIFGVNFLKLILPEREKATIEKITAKYQVLTS